MYLSMVEWRFKPGSGDRVPGLIRELLPTARGVAGLRHLYAAPAGENVWLSVLLYESQAHAEQGLNTLTPIARDAFGDSVLGMERRAGEVVIEEHFR